MRKILATAALIALAGTTLVAETASQAKMDEIRQSAINAGINVNMIPEDVVLTNDQANTVLAILSNSSIGAGQMEAQIREMLDLD